MVVDLWQLAVSTSAVLFAIIAMAVWCGTIQAKIKGLCDDRSKCPIDRIQSDLAECKRLTRCTWDILLEDGRLSRPDLFKEGSPLEATKVAKAKIPQDIRDVMVFAKLNGAHDRSDMVAILREIFTRERFCKEASSMGVNLQVYAAILEDTASDILNGRSPSVGND